MGEILRSSLLSTHEIIGMDDFNISNAYEPKNESQIGLLEIVISPLKIRKLRAELGLCCSGGRQAIVSYIAFLSNMRYYRA